MSRVAESHQLEQHLATQLSEIESLKGSSELQK